MNGIAVNELTHCDHINKLTVHSLERMIYQVSVEQNGKERFLIDDHGMPLQFSNTLEIRELVHNVDIDRAVLHLPNTYDEMIGRPPLSDTSPCEMPLGW